VKKKEKKSNHTDTTRSHVSGNHDWGFALLEFVENPITLVLLLVSVNGCGCVSERDKKGKRNEKTYRAPASRPDGGSA